MNAPAPAWSPWSTILLVACLALAALVGTLATRSGRPVVAPRDTVREALHDSVRHERALDSVRLTVWADSVLRLRGDSLARMWLARPARRLPGRVDSILMLDTLRDTLRLPGAAVRADAVRDSAREQVIDSIAGELAQREYDLRECGASLAAAPRANRWTVGTGIIGDADGIRPTASVGHRWGAFEVEGGAVLDRSRPGIIASARWAF